MTDETIQSNMDYLIALQYIADRMGMTERFDTDSKTLTDNILGYWKTQKAALEEKTHLIETLNAFIATQKIDLSACAAQREQLMTENAKLRETVERLKAPISDEEWRTRRDRTWLDSDAAFNAIIAARAKV